MTRRAIILALDGVLLAPRSDGPDDNLRLAGGAAEALVRASRAGFQTVVATHAPDVGRGRLDAIELADLQQRIRDLLAERGARLDGIYTCPHAPDREPACDCRKPASGLLRRARDEMGIELDRSWVVGRRERDLAMAETVGARSVRIADTSGPEPEGGSPAAFTADDLEAAIEGILQREAVPAPAGSR